MNESSSVKPDNSGNGTGKNGSQPRHLSSKDGLVNALPANTALIDGNGVIISVNDKWRDFARANFFQSEDLGVGDNYLRICDDAQGDGSADARAAAAGIRAVISGTEDEFTLEYPCHSPSELRWFRMMVTPILDDEGNTGAVVMHVNITQRKQAEEELRANAATMAAAQSIAHFGSWELDLRNRGSVDSNPLRWSDEMYRIAGFEPGEVEVTNELFFSMVPEEDHDLIHTSVATAIREHGSYSVIHRLIRADGQERILQEIAQIFADQETGKPIRMVGTAHDITNQRRADEKARGEEARYLRQRDALIALSSVSMSEGGDPSASFRRMTETTADTLGIARVSVWRLNHDRTTLLCQDLYEVATGQHSSGMQLSASDFPAYFAALVHEDVISADDTLHDSRTCEFAESYLKPLGITSMLDAVIRLSGKLEGVLCCEHVGPLRKWTPDEMTFAVSVANHVTLALEGWERRVTLDVVLKVAQAVSTAKGAEFFDVLTQNMIEALGADGGMIGQVHSTNRSIISSLALQFNGQRQENMSYSAVGTPCEGVCIGYACIFEQDIQRRFPSDEWLKEYNIESYVGVPLFNKAGDVSGIMSVFFCRPLAQIALVHSTLKIFAARAAAELERQESDARIAEQASLLDKAQDAILVRDLDHRILYWNKSAERLYGWTATEAKGRSVRELLYLDDSQFTHATQSVVNNGEWTGELIQSSRSGDEVIVQGRWTLVCDDHGRPHSILAINTDITERKKTEAQFLRAQRMESIGTLAGGVAHDLNNVLAPIMMAVDLLRLSVTEERALAIISTIDRSATRAADMVRQVLSFARGVEGQRVSINPSSVIRDLEQIVRESFPKNIEFLAEHAEVNTSFLGDPTQVHQILLNLCVNGRDAMPNGGRLRISTGTLLVDANYAAMNSSAKPGKYVVIAVQDSGAGIPKRILEKIFDPFFTTKEQGVGTGLGLSTTLGIVNSHGGYINVESKVGEGSTFTVHFPAELKAFQNNPQNFSSSISASIPAGNGELILIVDDEDAVREITRSTLEGYGFKTLVARDGAEAIAIYAQNLGKIEVVITDLMMPVMDGPATITVLRRMNPLAKIIAVTGVATPMDTARMKVLGVKSLLPKPYTAQTILVELNKVLEARD